MYKYIPIPNQVEVNRNQVENPKQIRVFQLTLPY